MKKVKILCSSDAVNLEQIINEFIKDKKLIDIKSTSVPLLTGTNEFRINDRVIIIYEVDEREG